MFEAKGGAATELANAQFYLDVGGALFGFGGYGFGGCKPQGFAHFGFETLLCIQAGISVAASLRRVIIREPVPGAKFEAAPGFEPPIRRNRAISRASRGMESASPARPAAKPRHQYTQLSQAVGIVLVSLGSLGNGLRGMAEGIGQDDEKRASHADFLVP